MKSWFPAVRVTTGATRLRRRQHDCEGNDVVMMLVMMMVMVSVMSMNHDRSEDYNDEGDADDAGDEMSPSFYERC